MQSLSGGMRVAVFIVLITFVYLFCVTFLPMPLSGAEHSKTIVGFLLGTVVGTLLNYYWGNSSKREQGSQTDNIAIDQASDLEQTRIDSAKEIATFVEDKRLKDAKEVAEKVIEEAKKGGLSSS